MQAPPGLVARRGYDAVHHPGIAVARARHSGRDSRVRPAARRGGQADRRGVCDRRHPVGHVAKIAVLLDVGELAGVARGGRPVEVTVAAGTSFAGFTVSTVPVSSATSAVMSASYSVATKSATLSIKKPRRQPRGPGAPTLDQRVTRAMGGIRAP